MPTNQYLGESQSKSNPAVDALETLLCLSSQGSLEVTIYCVSS